MIHNHLAWYPGLFLQSSKTVIIYPHDNHHTISNKNINDIISQLSCLHGCYGAHYDPSHTQKQLLHKQITQSTPWVHLGAKVIWINAPFYPIQPLMVHKQLDWEGDVNHDTQTLAPTPGQSEIRYNIETTALTYPVSVISHYDKVLSQPQCVLQHLHPGQFCLGRWHQRLTRWLTLQCSCFCQTWKHFQHSSNPDDTDYKSYW